jgi:hypothetical protein
LCEILEIGLRSRDGVCFTGPIAQLAFFAGVLVRFVAPRPVC